MNLQSMREAIERRARLMKELELAAQDAAPPPGWLRPASAVHGAVKRSWLAHLLPRNCGCAGRAARIDRALFVALQRWRRWRRAISQALHTL